MNRRHGYTQASRLNVAKYILYINGSSHGQSRFNRNSSVSCSDSALVRALELIYFRLVGLGPHSQFCFLALQLLDDEIGAHLLRVGVARVGEMFGVDALAVGGIADAVALLPLHLLA